MHIYTKIIIYIIIIYYIIIFDFLFLNVNLVLKTPKVFTYQNLMIIDFSYVTFT